MNFLKRNKDAIRIPKATGKLWDMRKLIWGRSLETIHVTDGNPDNGIYYCEGKKNKGTPNIVKWGGWMNPRPKVGDEIVRPCQSGKDGVYRFIEVEHCSNPPDMFFGTAVLVRYLGEDEKPVVPGTHISSTFKDMSRQEWLKHKEATP